MSSLHQVLAQISQAYHAAINSSDSSNSNKTESSEDIKAKEKRYFKKIICPNCFTEIETLSEPCPVCTAIERCKLGENQ